jgi:hypothetical protein
VLDSLCSNGANFLAYLTLPYSVFYKYKIMRTIKKTTACVNLQAETRKLVTHGLKQADGLAPTLFNSAVYHATRKLAVGTRWTLEQILGYSNNINILERRLRYTSGIFEGLVIAGEDVG